MKLTQAEIAELVARGATVGPTVGELMGADTRIEVPAISMKPRRESQFQADVIRFARHHGWKCYHTHDSRKSEPGFLDLVMARDRVIFAELKMPDGRLTPEQVEWLEFLARAGAITRVWRPQDAAEIERELR